MVWVSLHPAPTSFCIVSDTFCHAEHLIIQRIDAKDESEDMESMLQVKLGVIYRPVWWQRLTPIPDRHSLAQRQSSTTTTLRRTRSGTPIRTSTTSLPRRRNLSRRKTMPLRRSPRRRSGFAMVGNSTRSTPTRPRRKPSQKIFTTSGAKSWISSRSWSALKRLRKR